MGQSPFLAEIMLFAGNFAPRGYALCDGQTISISQNSALFAILGTTYGGNGQTTFSLPDLRSRVPVHPGTGPGLSNIQLGEVSGSETATIQTTQLPAHSHAVTAAASATTKDPLGAIPAFTPAGASYGTAPTGTMAAGAVAPTGGGQPLPIRNPYLGLNYCIALEGIFPSRN